MRVKRQGWGESYSIRLWEREAYVLNGGRTSPKGEVRESKHAVEPGANSTGPCGRPHGRQCAIPVPTLAVTFISKTTTSFGQTVKIVGSIAQLDNWNTACATALSASKYTNANPLWSTTIDLPAGTSFEYKFIKAESSGAVTYESGANRVYTVPKGCASGVLVDNTWK
jgi:hypothetical protein